MNVCFSRSLFTFVWFLFFVTWKLLWTRNNQGKTDHPIILRWNKKFWTFLKRRVFFWLCIWFICDLIPPSFAWWPHRICWTYFHIFSFTRANMLLLFFISYILSQFLVLSLSLDNDLMATSKRRIKLFSLIFILKYIIKSRGGKRRGLGPRNDVLTTCKAVTLRCGQRIVALFPNSKHFWTF